MSAHQVKSLLVAESYIMFLYIVKIYSNFHENQSIFQ